jgi:serine/threonine-protein kinase HipA
VALKWSLLRKNERFTAPVHGNGGDWIGKLPDARHPDLPRQEYAMNLFARDVGIDTPESHLVHRDLIDVPDEAWPGAEEYAFLVKRFDRGEDRGPIHIEDFAQVRSLPPEKKYQGTFETVASFIYRNSDEASLGEFARRLAFFVLIGNDDAHLKNWSLIYPDRFRARLSPSYDIVATENYLGPAKGLSFGGETLVSRFRVGMFERLQRRLRAQTDLGDVVRDTVARTVDAWPKAAGRLDGLDHQRRQLEQRIRTRARTLLDR